MLNEHTRTTDTDMPKLSRELHPIICAIIQAPGGGVPEPTLIDYGKYPVDDWEKSLKLINPTPDEYAKFTHDHYRDRFKGRSGFVLSNDLEDIRAFVESKIIDIDKDGNPISPTQTGRDVIEIKIVKTRDETHNSLTLTFEPVLKLLKD